MISRTLLGLIVFVLLTGCVFDKKRAIDVMIIDGCLVDIKGLTIESGKTLLNTWDIGDDCVIKTDSEINR